MINLNLDWKFQEVLPKISAYTTTYNCLNGHYPFREAIKSFLWCDELIVADGGSTDGTKEELETLAKEYVNLRVYDFPVDLDNPGKDGQLKAMARAMCSEEFCVQFDGDEFCLGDAKLWKRTAKNMEAGISILNCLVVEPFGSPTALRLNESHNPAKWRIYRNLPEITHGIPDYDRFEKDGKVFSKKASDGTFPLNIVNNKLFPSKDINDVLSSLFVLRKEKKYDEYLNLVKDLILTTPSVYHAGHVNLKSKIKLYLSTWRFWWCCLYDLDPNDPVNNQYFPDIEPKDVTEEMINEKVAQLIKETPTIDLGGKYEFVKP